MKNAIPQHLLDNMRALAQAALAADGAVSVPGVVEDIRSRYPDIALADVELEERVIRIAAELGAAASFDKRSAA